MESSMKPKVNFSYDLEKDAWSWVAIAKSKDLWGLNWHDQVAHIPDDLLDKIKKNNFAQSQKHVEKYIKENPRAKYKKMIIRQEMNALEKSWRLVEKKYFKTLADLTQRSIFAEKFVCYFTTGVMCPYDEKENWFTVSMWHSIPVSITTICHEVMHLQFLYYYKSYLKKKGLKNNQIENLKEALTFLLNEKEFDEIILCDDNGYPEHQQLRRKLQALWKKERNFEKLIYVGINLAKLNQI
jgi:hypothetical protein